MSLAPFPTNTREQIEEIIGMIGRDVEIFYVYSTYGCPDCDLDPVTDTSVDSFCVTCSGEYWIPVYSGVTMSGHVTWKFDYENEFQTGGKVLLGDARVKVIHTDEREAIIKRASYIVVDDIVLDIEKTTLLGGPQINRIVMDLKEREQNV